MKSSRRTVSMALRSRSERRSPRRPSSPIFASRSRRRSSSPLTGWLGGGMTHPLFIRLLSLGPVGTTDFIVVDRGSRWSAPLARSPFARERGAGRSDPLPLVRRFQNVHPDDQPILEPIAVANARIGDELAGARV